MAESTHGEDADAAGTKPAENLLHGRRMGGAREVPDAVPGGDEVVVLSGHPVAHICVMEDRLRMTSPGEPDHAL